MTTATPAPEIGTATADRQVPVWQHDPNAAALSDAERDYLFDVRGFDVIQGALSADDLAAVNAFVDRHDIQNLSTGTWLGHVETHNYGSPGSGSSSDGMNFQNIIEGGPVFEKCIDHPSWIDRVARYIAVEGHHLSIDENFLNVRQSGGFIPTHSGGAQVRLTSSFRNHAGKWMVGQINILMALTDIGLGDGCTTVVPGSHKAHMDHPVNHLDDDGKNSAWERGISGAQTAGMVQVHLKAGDALMFTDALTHGSIPRTNPGERRVMIYRYAPHLLARRFNYLPSDEMLARLTPRQKHMVMPQPPRFRPGRTLTFAADDGPRDVVAPRD